MSPNEPRPHEPMREVPPSEPDALSYGAAMLVAAVALALFAGGVLFADLERANEARALGEGKPLAPKVGVHQIGIVYQQTFPLQRDALKRRRAETQRLHSYGWSDRAKGLVHVPIEVAAQQMLAGKGGQR